MAVTFTGSYGQPIVMGLTPFTKTMLTPPTITTATWPPVIDADRLERYTEFEALAENRPVDVFDDLGLKPEQKAKIVLAAALPELICNVWADAVWSDPPTFELPNDAAQTAWDEIDEANEYTEIRGWESIFSGAMRGTSVIRLYRDEARGASTGDPVVIEEVNAGIFFPKLRGGSDRVIEYVVLAWEELREGSDRDAPLQTWQVREVHAVTPESGRYTITTAERKGGTTEFRNVREQITDLDFLPFVDLHAKRWSGRYWGLSEIGRCMSFFDEVDNTFSNIAEILEYHGKPMLQVPFSALFGGVLSKGADRTLGIRNPEEAAVARYITYDGQISAQLESLDKSIEMIFLTSEVPRTYFGLGLEGGAPSGVSLRLQLQNYLKKADRWQRAETRRAKQVIDYALRIRGGFDESARLAKVTHGSPLPADDVQEATTEAGLYTAGLSSRETSIRKLRRVPEDEVDDEIARIEADRESAVGGLPAPISPGTPSGTAAGEIGRPEPPTAGTEGASA